MTALLSKPTRFRAYQLGEPGSSFSYFDGSTFTLIEARVTDLSRPCLKAELEECDRSGIGCLHITGWDNDHCGTADLEEILDEYAPARIEYPGYEPHTDTAKTCLELIRKHKRVRAKAVVQKIDPPYIRSLEIGPQWGYRDILYHPQKLSDNNNDNSTIKLFRTGCFNVASLGDVESNFISAWLRRLRTFSTEVDVLILAHHGAENGFTSSAFLRLVRPTVAVCSADYDNKFDHPRQEIRDLLHKYEIPLFTTKTGDIVIKSLSPHTQTCKLLNLIADSHQLSSEKTFTTKKSRKLHHNLDTVRQTYAGNRAWYKKF